MAIILLPGLKLPTPSCSATVIKEIKFGGIFQEALGIFLLRMRRNDYLGVSDQKSGLNIRPDDGDFLLVGDIFTVG